MKADHWQKLLGLEEWWRGDSASTFQCHVTMGQHEKNRYNGWQKTLASGIETECTEEHSDCQFSGNDTEAINDFWRKGPLIRP